ncbi:MAG: hypothetical protein ACK5W9_10180 [Bdellovibrionales bacterium]
MNLLFKSLVFSLTVISSTSLASDYACRLSNSAVGSLIGKFRESTVESCLDKCNYDFDGRLKQRFETLQSLSNELERLYNPNAKSKLEAKSAKEIFDKIKSIKASIQSHQGKCLDNRRDGAGSKETLDCLNKFS